VQCDGCGQEYVYEPSELVRPENLSGFHQTPKISLTIRDVLLSFDRREKLRLDPDHSPIKDPPGSTNQHALTSLPGGSFTPSWVWNGTISIRAKWRSCFEGTASYAPILFDTADIDRIVEQLAMKKES